MRGSGPGNSPLVLSFPSLLPSPPRLPSVRSRERVRERQLSYGQSVGRGYSGRLCTGGWRVENSRGSLPFGRPPVSPDNSAAAGWMDACLLGIHRRSPRARPVEAAALRVAAGAAAGSRFGRSPCRRVGTIRMCTQFPVRWPCGDGQRGHR